MAPSTKRVETRLINRNNIEVALRTKKTSNTAVFENLLVNNITPQKVAYAYATKNDESVNKDQAWKEGKPRPWMNKEQSPFFKVDVGAEGDMTGLKNILRGDLKHSVSDHWVPGTGDLTSDYEQAQMLVDNIDKPYFQSQGFVCRLPSTGLLDRATLRTSKVETADTPEIGGQQLTVSVLRHDHLVAVEHNSEHWSYVTVLSGEMIWIIWPDTPHNISTMRHMYEDKTKNNGNPRLDLEDVADKLQHGIMWGQNPGDSLVIPPFHIVAGLSTKTTVLVEYSRMRFSGFMESLESSHIALVHSYYNSEALGTAMRFMHGEGLVNIITQILNNQIEDDDAVDFLHNKNGKSMISTLVRKWDSIKDNIQCFLSEENKKQLQNAWTDFLTQVEGEFGHRCAICNYGLTHSEEMEAHVLEEHYPGNDITATGLVNVESHPGQNSPQDAGFIKVDDDPMYLPTGSGSQANIAPATLTRPPTPYPFSEVVQSNQQVGNAGDFFSFADYPVNMPTGGAFQANIAPAILTGPSNPYSLSEVFQSNQQAGNVGDFITGANISAVPFGFDSNGFDTQLNNSRLEDTVAGRQGSASGRAAGHQGGTSGHAAGEVRRRPGRLGEGPVDTPERYDAFIRSLLGEQ